MNDIKCQNYVILNIRLYVGLGVLGTNPCTRSPPCACPSKNDNLVAQITALFNNKQYVTYCCRTLANIY